MPQNPQYTLRDANSNVLGTLYINADGEVALHHAGSNEEMSLGTNGIDISAISANTVDTTSATVSNAPSSNIGVARRAEIDSLDTAKADKDGAGTGTITNYDEIESEFALHSNTIDSDHTIPAGMGSVIAGELSGTGSVSGDGSLAVIDEGIHNAIKNPLEETVDAAGNDITNVGSVDADRASIGGRDARTTSDITISVPEDFSVVQDAIDAAVALSMEGSVTVSIDGSYYAESPVIPSYLIDGVANTTEGAVSHLTIQGSSDTNGNPTTELDGLLVAGGVGLSNPTIKSLHFRSDHPNADEGYAAVIQGVQNARLRNITFGTNVTNGILFYGSGGKAEACNYDNVDVGVLLKRAGQATVTESSGSPNTLMEVQEGIGVRKNTAGATPNVPMSLSGGGGIAINKDTNPAEIQFAETIRQAVRLDQGAGYPRDVNLANVTPKFDGQFLRDDGTNFTAGEYAYADTTNGVWRAFSDPANLTVAY